jgi:hypothetical protein
LPNRMTSPAKIFSSSLQQQQDTNFFHDHCHCSRYWHTMLNCLSFCKSPQVQWILQPDCS